MYIKPTASETKCIMLFYELLVAYIDYLRVQLDPHAENEITNKLNYDTI